MNFVGRGLSESFHDQEALLTASHPALWISLMMEMIAKFPTVVVSMLTYFGEMKELFLGASCYFYNFVQEHCSSTAAAYMHSTYSQKQK